jgi:hypothetical protein
MTVKTNKVYALLLGLALAGCTTAGTGRGDDDDSTPPEDTVCHGDALAENVPLDDDLNGLRERWDLNSELLGILFLGEPL